MLTILITDLNYDHYAVKNCISTFCVFFFKIVQKTQNLKYLPKSAKFCDIIFFFVYFKIYQDFHSIKINESTHFFQSISHLCRKNLTCYLGKKISFQINFYLFIRRKLFLLAKKYYRYFEVFISNLQIIFQEILYDPLKSLFHINRNFWTKN